MKILPCRRGTTRGGSITRCATHGSYMAVHDIRCRDAKLAIGTLRLRKVVVR